MQKQYLECGKILSTHGINGELRVQPWCDSPQELAQLGRLYLDAGQTPLEVTGARVHKNMVLLSVKGVDSIDGAAALRGRVIYLDRADMPLQEGEYFIQDLLGIEVVDADDGRVYGRLTEVSQTGANDVYHIAFDDGSVRLIPAIDQVVISTDLAERRMTIRPLKGLFDDED
jgi:16S rRNA processing protein RimM